MTLEDIKETKSMRITKGNTSNKIDPGLYISKSACLKNMYVFARFVEILLMTLRKQNILCI